MFTFASRSHRHRWRFFRSLFAVYISSSEVCPKSLYWLSLSSGVGLVCDPFAIRAHCILAHGPDCTLQCAHVTQMPLSPTHLLTIHTSLYRHFSGFRILTECGSLRISAKPCSPAIWWWCLLWSALAEANPLYRQAEHHNQNVILLMAFCIAWWLN